MIVLEPVAVTPATLISSTVAETEYPAWASGTSYVVGDRVIRQHRVRESLVAGNVGNAPESYPDKWLDVGPTNRWAMFDPAAGPQTSRAGQIEVEIVPVVPLAAVGVVDAHAAELRVRVFSGGVAIHDELVPGGGTRLFTGLPTPSDQRIIVSVNPVAGLAAIGKLLIGATLDVGVTETGPTVGITDYSRRETDDFGVTTIVERAWARRIGARTRIDTAAFDGVQKAMTRLLSKPALWVVGPDVQALAAYGFIKDFGANYTLRDTCFAGITVEGLPGAARIDNGTDPAIDGQSDLQVVPPVEITDAILTSSTIAALADHAAWSAGTTYAVSDRVTVAADRRIYESLVAGNTGNPPSTAPDKWLDIGPTSRWAMFDQALGTQSSATAAITVVLTPPSPVDIVALLDVGGASVRLRVTDASTDVFDQTLPGGGQKVWTGLPKPAGQKIIVTVEPQAGVAQVGTLLIGTPFGLGRTEDAPQAGLTDYSRKDTDDFGNTTVVPRGTAKRLTVRSMIATTSVDDVVTRMVARRAKPSLWLATDAAEALAIYGFARDFSLTIGENTSVGAFTIEGLTKASPSPSQVPVPTDGQSAYSIILTNDGEQLPATYDGVVTSYAAATTGVRVYYGGDNVTAQFAPVALVPGDGRNPQDLTIGGTYPDFAVTAGFDAAEDNASFMFRVAGTGDHAGVVLDKVFSLSKSKAALDGSSPPLVRLVVTPDVAVHYDKNDNIVTGNIFVTPVLLNTDAPPLFRLIRPDGTVQVSARTVAQLVADFPTAFQASGPDGFLMTQAYVNALIQDLGGITIRCFLPGDVVFDAATLVKVKDGSDGSDGADGADGIDGTDGISPLSVVPSVTSLAFDAYYASGLKPGQLSKTFVVAVTRGGANVIGGASITLEYSGCEPSISGAGEVSFTEVTASGYVKMIVSQGGDTLAVRVPITLNKDAPPGNSAQLGTARISDQVTSTSYPSAPHGKATVVCDSDGTISGTLGVEYVITDAAGSPLAWRGQGKLAYRLVNSTPWSDFTSGAVLGTSATFNPFGEGGAENNAGTLEINQSQSSLTVGASYEVGFFLRKFSGSSNSAGVNGDLGANG